MIEFFKVFILFIIYSFIGWLIEEIVMFFHTKKIQDRGFLIGPYCPIYGVAAILMIFMLKKYQSDIGVLFVMSVLICSIVEYITSYLMEIIFHARWWDYSHMRFNVNGRICLSNSILFGFSGVLLTYYINPFIVSILNGVSHTGITIFGIITIIIFITDICISFNVIKKIRIPDTLIKHDYTQEISDIVKQKLSEKSFFTKRVLNAFPNAKLIKKKSK